MASGSNNYPNMRSPNYASDPTSPNTTFVQADPSTFRAVVQRLTGAPEDPSAQKLPVTVKSHHHSSPKPNAAAAAAAIVTEMGPRRPNFKLHERRHATKKLELNIDHTATFNRHCMNRLNFNVGPSPPPSASSGSPFRPMIFSPVSPLEFYARGSPRTPREMEEEEGRAIAEKGFYLHPSPLSTPRGSDPPALLPLFPLHSPRDANPNSSPSS